MNIKSHDKNQKAMLFNEIYSLIFEKNKTVCAHERSVVQLMIVVKRGEKSEIVNNFKCTAKTHSTLDKTKIISLYAEHLHFLIKKTSRLVRKIYERFTFEQLKFKKDFVVMSQKNQEKGNISRRARIL